MKKKSLHLFLFLFTHLYFIYAQQITTANNQQPNELIQNLVGDNCATASNVTSVINGNINNIISYGSFDRGTSNFPLQSGLVLSTGNVSSAGNAFNGQDLSEGEIDWTTDTDIQDILGIDQTLNATSIEFDFVSANNFVSFKYLFASDEYQQEYPCTFKDVFAILIKRANTADPYVNIAVVPETTSEVTTNTIRPNINGFCDAQNEDFFQGYNLGHTNFNGNTTVLNATTDIIPNETYHIKFVIADHIDERFDSAVFIEAEGFGNSIDLGPDQSVCGNDITLDANIDNSTAIYTWFLNGGVITGESNPTLEVNQSGTYNVEVSIPTTSGNCTLTDTIEIEIIPFQQAEQIDDMAICDAIPSDGLYDFDFSIKNNEIFDALPSTNYTISYHLSEDDAQNNNNQITGIYQNTEQTETIYVRIESLSGDCLQIGNFDIIVNSSPNTLEIDLNVCNEEIYGDFTISSLANLDFPVSNYEFNTTVTYYLTEVDAINAENALNNLPDVSSHPPHFFARVEDDFNSCPSIVTINFNYVVQPDVGVEKFVFSQCIDPLYYELTNTAPYSLNYDTLRVSYNVDDAMDEIEAMHPEIFVQLNTIIGGNPVILTTSDASYNIPISIRFHGENCATPMVMEFHKNLLYNLLSDEKIESKCDDPSNDGIVDIDLAELAIELADGYDIGLTFYETEEDRDNESNPLDINVPFSVTNAQSIYIASSFELCTHSSKVTFDIHPALNLAPISVDYCGNTDTTNNSTNIAILPLSNILLNDLSIAGPKEFYLTEEDAENQENEITESLDIIGNQQTIYVRITNIFTRCYDITTLQINIANAIEATNPEPIIICDDDQDGISTVNLEDLIPQLSGGSNDLSFTFFESYEDAVDNESPITNPSSFTTESKEIFIRGEIEALECFTIFNFDILIYANPQLNNISDFINCEIDTTNPSGFLFANKDLEILNGQTGMQVLYFESEEDAINRENIIDKNTAYMASSNPQTIYVRLENESGNSCFKIKPMQIQMRQAPIYNEPTDVFECDANGTGFVSTDLSEKITEITSGTSQDLTVTFHSTPLNANVGTNPLQLNYTTTNNPQLVYTRVENNETGCYEISTFYVNTLSLPEVNYGQSFTACANNYITDIEWDLTQKEIEILNGRQYNVDFTYYRSLADLENNDNSIANPETYTNTSNPETVYVKVRNASTECFSAVPIELIINMPPEVNDFETYEICDNEDNYFDLLEINEVVLDDTYNVLVNYYSNLADAEADANALNSDYYYTNSVENLFVRVEYTTTHCYAVYPFQLIINPLPLINQPNDLIACDDDYDGITQFDLSLQNLFILNGQNPNEFTINYFHSEIDAHTNNLAIETDYTAFNGEIIFVRVENNSTGCYSITQFSIIVNPLPISYIEDQVICLDNLPLTVSAETNNPTDTYFWSTNATSPEIEIIETGTYSVTITNQFGCESTSVFNVTESESAVIDVVEVIDFSDPNNITVTVNGIGNYLYQLNNLPFQTSNVFENVPIGFNTITIIDQNGCAQVTREVFVIDVPKHFTPNNDGDFDTWHIVGVESLPGTTIQIFDRHGKLLKELKHTSQGWDGTYKGNNMPAGDYWYIATVFQNGDSFELKGHFALRR